jgi:DNA invertase Pin-like site-specific DNA recombinase
MTKEVQEAKCEEYFKRHLQPEGYEWGGFYYDPAVSGSSPFAEREYGRQVFLLAQRGDMIVTAAMDRMFRSRKDGFHTLDMLEARGVKHVLLDMPMIDFDRMPRAYAEYMQGTLLLSAQLMRRVVSERMKEDNAIKRQQGLPYSRSAPIGWKIVGDRKSKAYRRGNCATTCRTCGTVACRMTRSHSGTTRRSSSPASGVSSRATG